MTTKASKAGAAASLRKTEAQRPSSIGKMLRGYASGKGKGKDNRVAQTESASYDAVISASFESVATASTSASYDSVINSSFESDRSSGTARGLMGVISLGDSLGDLPLPMPPDFRDEPRSISASSRKSAGKESSTIPRCTSIPSWDEAFKSGAVAPAPNQSSQSKEDRASASRAAFRGLVRQSSKDIPDRGRQGSNERSGRGNGSARVGSKGSTQAHLDDELDFQKDLHSHKGLAPPVQTTKPGGTHQFLMAAARKARKARNASSSRGKRSSRGDCPSVSETAVSSWDSKSSHSSHHDSFEKAQDHSFDRVLSASPRVVLDHRKCVIIFDYDDTLLPTTWIKGVVDPQHTQRPILREHPYYKQFMQLSNLVEEVLREANKIAHVAIVTLARMAWFETSADRYYPGFDMTTLLKELDIEVYSADCWAPVVETAVQSGKDRTQTAKVMAMSKCLNNVYGGDTSIAWNVVSVGDSMCERDALKECLQRQQYQRHTCCKTVKLNEGLNMEDLMEELREVLPMLKELVQATEDCDREVVSVKDKSKSSLFGKWFGM